MLDAGGSVDVTAAGSITGTTTGVIVTTGVTAGSITNSGTISGTTVGIALFTGSTLTGAITNNTGALIEGSTYGIYLYGASVNGGIINSGTITASRVGIRLSDSTINGGMTNSGTITADSLGINISNSTINGGFTNSGTITADEAGIKLKNSTINGGGFTNSGSILADDDYGIYLYGTPIGGNFTNSGLIENTDGYGVMLYGSDVAGDFTNSGTILADGDSGLRLYGSDIGGNFTNSGLIDNANNSGNGVFIQSADIDGNFANSGTILADGDYGLYLYSSDIGGSFTNSGLIDNTDGYGVFIESTDIAGSLTNSGTITGTNFGLFVTESEVSGGILNTGTIIATMSKALVVDDMDSVTTITNTGLLDGDVSFDDNILNLAGASGRITGDTDGNAGSVVNVLGEFTTEGDFDVDMFNVTPSGWLKVGNNITPTSGVNNLGVLAGLPGSMGTITGNYTQTGAGALGAIVNSAANCSQLMVTGTADLSANDTVTVFVNALLTPGQAFDDILTAGTLTSGTSLTATDDSVLWKFTALPDGNTVDLVTARDAFLANLASDYAADAGRVLDELLDSGQFSEEIRTILLQIAALDTAAEVTNAVDQLVTVLVGQGAFAATQAVNHISDIVSNQIDGQRGLSAGDPMFTDGHWWIKPFGGFGDHDVRGGVPGFNLHSYGIAAGIDVKPNDNLLVGGAFAWSEAEIDADTIGKNELDIQSYQFVLYGSYDLDARNYIDAHAIVGWNDNESRRDVTIGAFTSTARADYDSVFTRIYAGLGRKYAVSDQLTLSPLLNIRYTYIDEDGYTESGAPIALTVASNDEDSLIFGLDGVARYTFGPKSTYSMTAQAGVGYDAITDRTLVSSTFVGGGSTFATRGAEPDEFVYHASFSLNSDTTENVSVNIQYAFEGQQDFDVHGFSATLRMRF